MLEPNGNRKVCARSPASRLTIYLPMLPRYSRTLVPISIDPYTPYLHNVMSIPVHQYAPMPVCPTPICMYASYVPYVYAPTPLYLCTYIPTRRHSNTSMPRTTCIVRMPRMPRMPCIPHIPHIHTPYTPYPPYTPTSRQLRPHAFEWIGVLALTLALTLTQCPSGPHAFDWIGVLERWDESMVRAMVRAIGQGPEARVRVTWG